MAVYPIMKDKQELQFLDLVIEKAPELLDNVDELFERDKEQKENGNGEITLEQIINIVQWDKKNRKLKDFEYKFMLELSAQKTIDR